MPRQYSVKSIAGGRPRSAASRPSHFNPEGNPLYAVKRDYKREPGAPSLPEVVGCNKSTLNRSLNGAIIYPGRLIDGLAQAYEEGRLPGVDLPAVFEAYGEWLREDQVYFRFVQYHFERYGCLSEAQDEEESGS